MSAFCLSIEPSGKSGRALVIRTSRSVSSIRVRCISSIIVSTRILASIVFGRANRGLLAEAPCAGGGGRTACGRNEVEECFICRTPHSMRGRQKHLRPSADDGAKRPEARTGLVWGKEAAGVVRLSPAMRRGQAERLRQRNQALPRPRSFGSKGSPPNLSRNRAVSQHGGHFLMSGN